MSVENVFLLPAIFFFRVPDQGFLACIIHHACKPPKIEKPEEKYNWKEKENVHFYIWKTKSIPPQKQAPEGFLENWFPWSLFVQKGKEEMTKEERKKRVQEAWKKLKTTSRDSKEFKEVLTTWNKLDTEYLKLYNEEY